MWKFTGLISKIIIWTNEPAHALKFAKSKVFTGESALNGGAVHCTIQLVAIELMIAGGRNATG